MWCVDTSLARSRSARAAGCSGVLVFTPRGAPTQRVWEYFSTRHVTGYTLLQFAVLHAHECCTSRAVAPHVGAASSRATPERERGERARDDVAESRERERRPLAAFLAGCDASSLAARLVFDFQRRQKARATGFASSGWDGRAIGSGKAMGLNEVGLAWKVPRCCSSRTTSRDRVQSSETLAQRSRDRLTGERGGGVCTSSIICAREVYTLACQADRKADLCLR